MRRALVQRFSAAGHDVSAEEWAVLLILQAHPGLTASALSDKAFRDKTTTTRMVDRLARKGMVTRARDTDDRRVVHITLSPQGQAQFDALAAIAQQMLAQVMQGISPADLAIATQTLRRMTDNLKGDPA